MKNIVITMALLVLCTAVLLFQMDADLLERQTYRVKYTADRMANAATLFTDDAEFGRGRVVFLCDEGNALALRMLTDNLGYTASFEPQNGYFSERARVEMYYFDDSMTARHYSNGSFAGSFGFEYGDTAARFIAAFAGDDSLIEKPCAVCVLDVGEPGIRAGAMTERVRIVKKSIYEYR
ncbi:MAG: hypothetical protein IIZ55_05070 [Firmicutes bacterium]|nr:hypothetical protein [Bacillota bacterium]